MRDQPATDDEPMIGVTISDEAHQAVREFAAVGVQFVETGERQPDGTWVVPLSKDVIDALNAHRFPGESDSDVILRTIAVKRGAN